MSALLLHLSGNRITKFLDRLLESLLRSLGSIILYIYDLVFKAYVEILDSLLECDVLLNLLHTVCAVKMYAEGDLLKLCLLSRSCI